MPKASATTSGAWLGSITPPEPTRMVRVWPELGGCRVSHSWKGALAFTFDRLPHMGISAGAHFAMGCNGSGVAMAAYLGHQLAQKLLAASAASPTELAPGVVLLHVHCPGIDEAVVAGGSGHVHFPESAMEAEVVLGLFAPREQSAERHLLCLAELARRFNDAHIAARAAAGAPAEELCRLLVSNGPSRNK